VGGNVQASRLLSKTNPVYPESARQQGIEGAATVQAVIGTTGNFLDAHVVGTQTNELAQAALAAVRTWQFEPTRLNGEPVEVLTEVTVNFRLDSTPKE
jgi:protein TonB